MAFTKPKTKPLCLRWRSSSWFVTFVVGLGITTELLTHSLIIPVLPFQLQKLGYSDVSGLVGWLLFASSAGLLISTPPIASLSERYKNRQAPLVIGLVTLMISQVMLMEVPKYSIIVLARVIQGISSSVVWVVGLALLSESTPEELLGRQIGIAMTGLSLGVLVGPPAAGALYDRWGLRAPFIFGVIMAAIDLLGRLLIVERKDAIIWGVDPAAGLKTTAEAEAHNRNQRVSPEDETLQSRTAHPSMHLTPFLVLMKLLGSPRAMVCVFGTLLNGIVCSGQESVLVLHLQAVWDLSPSQAGLAYIAAIVPTFIAMPVAGWLADKKGPEWVLCLCPILALPWWMAATINGTLTEFLAFIAMTSFFTSAGSVPLTAELAAVCRSIDGIGYAHVYAAFNFAYGVGSAVGPIVSGQIYDHSAQGWTIFCLLTAALLLLSAISAFVFAGERPLITRVLVKTGRGI